jgi:hypothetical protein
MMTSFAPPFEFNLAIAGLAIQLRTRHPELKAIMDRRYGLFSVHDLVAQMTIDLAWQPINNANISNDIAVTFSGNGLEFESSAASGKIDLNARHAVIHCATTRSESALEYFLRLVYSLLAFEAGGLMLHGAGILRSGVAAVFFGHSGSGKTTVSHLSGEDAVLNDDLLFVMPEGAGWQVAATPFWNPSQMRPTLRQAPLGGLFRLVQDKRVMLCPASPAVAIAELISSVPVINADPRRMPLIIARLMNLNAYAPVQFLHFLPDTSFWKVVDPALNPRE